MKQTSRLTRYLYITPLVLLVLGLTIFPTLFAYWISAHNAKLIGWENATFVGLENYQRILGTGEYAGSAANREFFEALWFSLRFAFIATILELGFGMALALWFNRRKLPGRGLFLSLMLLPIMVSPALLGIMFRLMLNQFVGPLAYYLQSLGLPGRELLTPNYILTTLIVIDLVQWTPFSFLILYSALKTVPREFYEAAAVDGGSAMTNFRYITVPLILPFIFITLLVRGIDSFKTFDMIYVLTGGGPGTLTTTVSIHIYKTAFNASDIGRASAASLLLLLALSIPLGMVLARVRSLGAR